MKTSVLFPLSARHEWGEDQEQGEAQRQFLVPFLNATAKPEVACNEYINYGFLSIFLFDKFHENKILLEPKQ